LVACLDEVPVVDVVVAHAVYGSILRR
jgi:hypothetical protein